MPSPVGTLLLTAEDGRLRGISFPGERAAQTIGRDWCEDPAPFEETVAQLEAYFRGARDAFDLPLAPVGTPFQLTVWEALQTIPLGETMTYGALAARIGKPTASRAVGAANGANPLPIVIPCHRVIGADGSLIGFGGGVEIKRWLLDHEGALGESLPLFDDER